MSDETNDVSIRANRISTGSGGVVGVDNSKGKMVMVNLDADLSNPVTLILAAAKRIAAVWWFVGAAAVTALVAIASQWAVSPLAVVFGTIGIFVSTVALYLFASLLKPPPANKKPPLPAMVMLWSLLLIFVASGACTFTSFFFDRPIPMRSLLLEQQKPATHPA